MLAYCSVNGQNSTYIKTGIASFYADKFEGRITANGEIYYHAKKTAAHQNLAFGTIVKVTNLENNKFVVVRINDRGPFVDNRIIDLSKSAAKELGFVERGLAKVKIKVIANTNDLPDKKPSPKTAQKKGTYFKVNSEVVSPKGKGVQIGSYKANENIFKLAAKLKTKYNVEVYIETVDSKSQTLYRVILGNYTGQNQLENLKSQLSKDFPDCFIVQYK